MPENSDGDPAPVQSGAATDSASNRKSGRNRGRRNRENTQPSEKFEGKCADLKGHVYDLSSATGKIRETFQKTTREIAEYIGREFDDAGDFRTGLVELNLPGLIEPVMPQDPDANRGAFEKWKFSYSRYEKELASRKKNLHKAFALILGQCSQAVRDIIESNEKWADINARSDVIALLKLIQQAIVAKRTTVHRIQSLVETEHEFYGFRQGKMSHSEYFDRFKDLVETVSQKGGDLGAYQELVDAQLGTEGLTPSTASDSQYEDARARCRERYLAMCLILKADKRRVGDLVVDLENEHTRNPRNASYPETLAKAYDMIINYRPRMSNPIDVSGETGVTFVTNADEGEPVRSGRGGARGGRGSGRGGGRGGRDGKNRPSSGAQEKESSDSQFLLDSADKLDSDSGYYDCRRAELTCAQSNHKLPHGWMLLDSCSTINLIADASLLRDVFTADTPLHVRCNAGWVTVRQQGYYDDYPDPVWHWPEAVANILSFAKMAAHYR
ncbi:MAG: hypothetical protein PF483_00315, partial [Halothiobacillus sp.]|nr:hypothetical protein [Halothiobacillus sp.]